MTASSKATVLPNWPILFWTAVGQDKDVYGLHPDLVKVLEAHGYVGRSTITPPRTDELRKELGHYESQGAPQHGAATSLLEGLSAMPGASFNNPENLAWHLRLPSELQRAAPEIYRNIRAEGSTSVRNWVLDLVPSGQREGNQQFQDLHSAATIIDFELAQCTSEAALLSLLATSDALEVNLRKLSSYVHFKRTKDKSASLHMLGIRAPGTGTDIAPDWLVTSSSDHSKNEHRREERGRSSALQTRPAKGGGKVKGKPRIVAAKGESKGGDKGGTGGSGAGGHATQG